MMIEDPVNHEDRDDRHMSELLARLTGLGSHSVTPQQIMPWLVELFKFWKEGEEWRVVALSGDIARKLSRERVKSAVRGWCATPSRHCRAATKGLATTVGCS